MDFTEKIDQAFSYMSDGAIYRVIMDDMEKLLIEKALEKTNGNQIWAARLLGLNRNTLRSKIKKFNISLEKYRQ
ncbi:MAG: helix-turn-helix domain-containing protein [Candidatus Omnitrophota bacterium]|nr:helix-turn-helix domain-containing protein [Candidatus Omnitrophota bacterium]